MLHTSKGEGFLCVRRKFLRGGASCAKFQRGSGSNISRGRGVIPVHTSGGGIQISSDIIVPNLPHIDSACD